jgi:drug/metabolite transporter (DMT)-like permease
MPSINYASMMTYVLLVLIGLTSSASEILLFKGVKAAQPLWLMAAFALWIASLSLMGLLFRAQHFSFSAVVVLATLVHLLVALLWGVAFADAKLSPLEIAGLLLALFAILLLEAGRAQA